MFESLVPYYYFNDADADLILRTSNVYGNAPFRVHKHRLSEASTVFRDMLAMPQPYSDGTPFVDVSETKEVIDKLLRFIYPCDNPVILDLASLVGVIEAAVKYDAAIVVATLKPILIKPEFLTSNPVRVYAIAIRFDFAEEMKVAEAATLSVELKDIEWCSDLDYMKASQYHRLITLHTNRSRNAMLVVDNSETPFAHDCKCKIWYDRFRSAAKEELSCRPTTDVIASLDFLARIMQDSEERCNLKYSKCLLGKPSTFLKWVQSIKNTIDRLPVSL